MNNDNKMNNDNNLTATWFFSQKQKDRQVSSGRIYFPKINGIEYTEVKTMQDMLPHKSAFEDALVVFKRNDLTKDLFFEKHFGKIRAKI